MLNTRSNWDILSISIIAPSTKNNIDAVIRKLYEQARQGDTASIALLLKIRGEDVQKVELAAAPPTIVGDFGETDNGDAG